MNNEVIALCGGADLPSELEGVEIPQLLIGQNSPANNLRLEIENVSHRLLKNLSDISLDFLDIASYVYFGDGSVNRGTNKDVFSEQWVRKFDYVIPVRRPNLWKSETIKDILTEFLEYLTEDRYSFYFTDFQAQPEQLIFKEISEEMPYSPSADCVMLFSGGMDSLSGSVYLQSIGKKPILASHQSNPVMAKLQRKLASSLRNKFPDREFPHLDITINRKNEGSPALENSQRSRSFLFFTFGSLIAFELGHDELFVCENGVTTFNFPRLGQTLGSMASRSTHPKIISLFGKLTSEVFNTEIKITNPFIWMTRSEVLEILIKNNVSSLLPLSSSCNHTRRPKVHPHCGTCSQCVDRRFAIAISELEKIEAEIMGYEKDIFFDELIEGEEIMQAMGPVQFSLSVINSDIDTFCTNYVQVYDAINYLDGDEEINLQNIHELHLRFAEEIHSVIGQKHASNWHRIFDNELPDTSLLMLTGSKSTSRSNILISNISEELIKKLNVCPISENKPYEDICEEIFSFLFCEDLPKNEVLTIPEAQYESDQGYERRDLIFRNEATYGYWADIRKDYEAEGIIIDSKNYKEEIDGNTVKEFSSKYIKPHGLGRFGIIVARQVPSETNDMVSKNNRVPSAIKAQKEEWQTNSKMIVLLGDEDLKRMLNMKSAGLSPHSIIKDKIFILKSRM